MNSCNLNRLSTGQSTIYYPVTSLAHASLLFLPSRLYLGLSGCLACRLKRRHSISIAHFITQVL